MFFVFNIIKRLTCIDIREFLQVADYFKDNNDFLPPPAFPVEHKLLLLGKTGTGKSCLGCTILGDKNAFPYSGSSASITSKMQKIAREISGRQFVIVDTPGVKDTRDQDAAIDEITRAIVEEPTGYDAFLLVVRYPTRFTPEEIETINWAFDFFGKEFSKYTIVIVTGGDSYASDERRIGENRPFGEFLKTEQKHTNSLAHLIQRCSGRWALFNNNYGTDRERRKQVAGLTEQIDKMRKLNKNRRFTNDTFEDAQKLYKEELAKLASKEQKRIDKIVQAKIETQKRLAAKVKKKKQCFPGDTMITKHPGVSVAIQDIAAGDLILTLAPDNSTYYTEVYMNSHVDFNSEIEVIIIKTANHTLKVSPGHYLPVNGQQKYKVSRDIAIGDKIFTCEFGADSKHNKLQQEEVISIDTGRAKGMFNPITMAGTLFVNGMLATCYEINPDFAHFSLGVLRSLYRIHPGSVAMLNRSITDGMPTWAWYIRKWMGCLSKL